MATDYTIAAVWRLGKSDGVTPSLTERHFLPDMLVLLAGVYLVAGLAAPAFFAVDMQKMQIHLAVPEFRFLT